MSGMTRAESQLPTGLLSVFASVLAVTLVASSFGCYGPGESVGDTGIEGDVSFDATDGSDARADGDGSDETGEVEEAEPVECGNITCGPEQYCKIQECCGADVGFDDAGNWRGSPSYSCIDVPDVCSANDACNCDSLCDCRDDRTVSCPAV